MPTDSPLARLLLGVRQLLVDNGVARVPSSPTPAGPPLWINRRLGIPAPGQTQGLEAVEVGQHEVMAMAMVTGIPGPPYEQSVLRKPAVELWYFVDKSPLAYARDEMVRALLMDKRDVTLPNGFWVSEILLYRELQPIASDNQGFVYNCQYLFEIWS